MEPAYLERVYGLLGQAVTAGRIPTTDGDQVAAAGQQQVLADVALCAVSWPASTDGADSASRQVRAALVLREAGNVMQTLPPAELSEQAQQAHIVINRCILEVTCMEAKMMSLAVNQDSIFFRQAIVRLCTSAVNSGLCALRNAKCITEEDKQHGYPSREQRDVMLTAHALSLLQTAISCDSSPAVLALSDVYQGVLDKLKRAYVTLFDDPMAASPIDAASLTLAKASIKHGRHQLKVAFPSDFVNALCDYAEAVAPLPHAPDCAEALSVLQGISAESAASSNSAADAAKALDRVVTRAKNAQRKGSGGSCDGGGGKRRKEGT